MHDWCRVLAAGSHVIVIREELRVFLEVETDRNTTPVSLHHSQRLFVEDWTSFFPT